MVLGLVASIVLASGSLLHALGMIVLGLLLGLVGTDVNSGTARYSFNVPELADGISFVTVAMGVFGLGEIIANLRATGADPQRADGRRSRRLAPTKEDWKVIIAPILRGTSLGAVLGILPGGGAMLASFSAYALEKKVSKSTPGTSARARSKAWQARSRPTTPARRHRSFPC